MFPPRIDPDSRIWLLLDYSEMSPERGVEKRDREGREGNGRCSNEQATPHGQLGLNSARKFLKTVWNLLQDCMNGRARKIGSVKIGRIKQFTSITLLESPFRKQFSSNFWKNIFYFFSHISLTISSARGCLIPVTVLKSFCCSGIWLSYASLPGPARPLLFSHQSCPGGTYFSLFSGLQTPFPNRTLRSPPKC